MPLLVHVIVWFLLFLVVEASASAWLRLRRYDLRDTTANLAMGAGGLVANVVGRAIALPISFVIYEHRVFDLESFGWVWAILIVADDFCYYCFHRVSHRVRLFWAAHEAHHSSPHYNLSTALRISWTTPITGMPFWWPLPLLGFHPTWILAVHSLSLVYQFALHTQFVGRLGPLEWVFNTPSHHRVHHGSDYEHIDKNFGAMLIVWDRLLGTFEPERRPPMYGLVHPLGSNNPLKIAFHAWRAMLATALRQGLSLRERCMVLFGAPERVETAGTRQGDRRAVDSANLHDHAYGSGWTGLGPSVRLEVHDRA